MGNNNSFGETDFTAKDQFVDSNEGDKIVYYKLKNGDNNMRAITNPHRFVVHKVVFEDDDRGPKKAGWTIRCMGTGCAICKAAGKDSGPLDWFDGLQAEKGKPRWYMGVIDRDDSPNKTKVLEFGTLVRGKLKGLADNKKWGSPLGFDIDITKDDTKPAAQFYDVLPDPTAKGPLGPEDEKLASTFNVETLKKRCQPMTADEAKDMIKRYRSWLDSMHEGKANAAQAKAEQAKKNSRPQAAAKPAVVAKDDEEDSDDEAPTESDYSFESTREA